MAHLSKELLSLPVLSIRQPFAWAIVHGHKTIENRTWMTKYRGRLLIHAGKAKAYAEDVADVAHKGNLDDIPRPSDLIFGAIIGVVDLVDCVQESRSPWFVGPYGFVLENARLLRPVPCRGRLGFFKASDVL